MRQQWRGAARNGPKASGTGTRGANFQPRAVRWPLRPPAPKRAWSSGTSSSSITSSTTGSRYGRIARGRADEATDPGRVGVGVTGRPPSGEEPAIWVAVLLAGVTLEGPDWARRSAKALAWASALLGSRRGAMATGRVKLIRGQWGEEKGKEWSVTLCCELRV